MFNFHCDFCEQYQQKAEHKYSVESFKYFTACTGNIELNSRHVCEKCVKSVENHIQKLKGATND